MSIKKLKFTVFIILMLLVNSTFSQHKHYTISTFSDKYYADFDINNSSLNKDLKNGFITIFDANNKQIINVEFKDLMYFLEANEKINFEGTSLIIHKDFNFDNQLDFAIANGSTNYNKDYSYQIYLQKNNEFVFNKDLSELTIDRTGLFVCNTKTKTIHTYHYNGPYEEHTIYKLINNKLRPILFVENILSLFPDATIFEWNGNIAKETKARIYNANENELLSFNLQKSGKKVILFDILNDRLQYVLLKDNDIIEFKFSENKKKEGFIYDKSLNTITFQNIDTKYEIYEKIKDNKITKIGINVFVNNKMYKLKGDVKTLVGSLHNLENLSFGNLIVK